MKEHLLVTIGKERFNKTERHTVHLVDDKYVFVNLKMVQKTEDFS